MAQSRRKRVWKDCASAAARRLCQERNFAGDATKPHARTLRKDARYFKCKIAYIHGRGTKERALKRSVQDEMKGINKVRLYTISVPFEDMWLDVKQKDETSPRMIQGMPGFAGVNPDVLHGKTNFLFRTKAQRDKAYEIARSAYENAAKETKAFERW